jgi:hypothetical protein
MSTGTMAFDSDGERRGAAVLGKLGLLAPLMGDAASEGGRCVALSAPVSASCKSSGLRGNTPMRSGEYMLSVTTCTYDP